MGEESETDHQSEAVMEIQHHMDKLQVADWSVSEEEEVVLPSTRGSGSSSSVVEGKN